MYFVTLYFVPLYFPLFSLREAEYVRSVGFELLIESILLTIEHGIEFGVETGTVVHLEGVGQFVEHDEALQLFGQQHHVEREMNVVLAFGREREASLYIGSARTPPAVSAVDGERLVR